MAQKRTRSPSDNLQTMNDIPSLATSTITSTLSSPPLSQPATLDANSNAHAHAHAQQQHQTKLFKSSPIHDRKSTFLAIFSPLPSEHVSDPKSLQRHPDFATADHKILAWRKPSSQQSLQIRKGKPLATATTTSIGADMRRICTTWSDDDGEKYAGKRLEKVLNEFGVEGVVVVARWWGGVMLGPARFTHIEDCAREAVRVFLRDTQANEPDSKRQKVDQERSSGVSVLDGAKERNRLIEVLKERDESVKVLRGLLGDKNKEIEILDQRYHEIQSSQKQQQQPPDLKDNPKRGSLHLMSDNAQAKTIERSSPTAGTSPPRPPDTQSVENTSSSTAKAPETLPTIPTSTSKPESAYLALPLETLKKLEKARDTTLSWILKQIDAVEVRIKDRERAIVKLQETVSPDGELCSKGADD